MLAVYLSNKTPQYVTGYSVMSIVEFNNLYKDTPNIIFVKKTDLQKQALTNFIQNFQKYFLQNGKLVLNVNM